jgi:hypothetical protein
MKGYIFVSPGSDPGAGRVLDDPILGGKKPTMGTCRPDLRRYLQKGDHIFVVSGATKGFAQYMIGGFEVDHKIDQIRAFHEFPDNRLHFDKSSQRFGNIIVNANGEHDARDHHDKLERRIQNYLIGTKPVVIDTPSEIFLARDRTLPILREMFNKPNAKRVSEVIGRNKRLNDKQVENLISALNSLKAEAARGTQHS